MSRRALDTNRQGIEITGHNLSNLSNPAYARQRLRIQTGEALPSPKGPTGTGSVVSAIEQVRSQLLDSQIAIETSITGFLESKQKALEFGEVNLGQRIDRQATTPEGISAAQGVGGQFGLVEGITEFFNSLQALSVSPNSTADRQVVLLKAENLTTKFNNVDSRLERLRGGLNVSVQDDIVEANKLIKEISDLSVSITSSELGGTGNANDLKDRRQQAVESLAKVVNLQTSIDSTTNTFSLSVSGRTLISANKIDEDLATFTDDAGGRQVRAVNRTTLVATNLTLTSGSAQGTINARDGAIASLKTKINDLANALATGVNTLHSPGFALDGRSKDRLFFTGVTAGSRTAARDIALNSALLQDPSLIQASADGQPGNNDVALSMARLASQTNAALGNLTFVESYNQSVANFGQALNNTNSQLLDQQAVDRMLLRQRDSLGGVSVDEEMTNLVIFQRAFQASAKMITTIDELIQSVIALSR